MKFEIPAFNWSAVWRKALVGLGFTALMGYTFKQNKLFDERMDTKYPAKKTVVETDTEITTE